VFAERRMSVGCPVENCLLTRYPLKFSGVRCADFWSARTNTGRCPWAGRPEVPTDAPYRCYSR